jgi:hypothetical protein
MEGPIDQVALRNRVVSEVTYGWMRIDELALALDVDLKSLVPVLKVLRLHEHIETDGRGRVRRASLSGVGAGPPSSAPMRQMTGTRGRQK